MIYYPQIKTTASELCAYEKISVKNDDEKIVPILQITKPRITKSIETVQSLKNHLEKVFKRIGNEKKAIVDITSDETYQDANLNQYIHDSSNGYVSWIERLKEIKSEYNGNIIPSIVGNASVETLPDIKKQISTLLDDYESISIRFPVKVDDDFSDLSKILNILGLERHTKRLFVLFDFDYRKSHTSLIEQIKRLEEFLVEQDWHGKNIVLFSSCPSSFDIKHRVSEYVEKIEIAEYAVMKSITALSRLEYGDYAYIHPKRNESAGFWLPRLDYPAQDGFCYYLRSFNKVASRIDGKLKIETTFSNDIAYKNLAKKVVTEQFFIDDRVESWGRQTITENTFASKLSGKSPQHYIAIRSNIHMERVLDHLEQWD